MNRLKKAGLWLITGVTLGLAAQNAHAATSVNVDIKVSVSATKSLAANTTTYDFGALSVGVSSVSASAITITNDSGALIETYTAQGADAVSTGGGTTWTLAASTATDQYALAAQFSSARPTDVDGSWGSDDLTTSAIPATATTLGNGTAGESGAAVSPAATRSLWFRIKTPGAVSDTTQRKATLTLAVQ